MSDPPCRRVDMFIEMLAKNWWVVALRGVAAIMFGLLAMLMPGMTLAALVLLFGAYALVEGVLNVIAAVRGRGRGEPWWALLIEGIVSIGAGLVTFFMPGLTALVLVYVIAAWPIITGVLEIVTAIRLRKLIRREWLLALSGVLSVAFGLLMIVAPGPGALALVLWIGAYSLVFGAPLVGLSLRLRRPRDEDTRVPLTRAA